MNRNIFWAKTFVDELARCGLEAVCIAPGSRSTPLVIAFAENPHIKVYSHIDERSAAFFALGMALATDKPVAVLCSSGTATANFHPAVIEAKYANVPLIVLTADRQHELRESGANQTIDQVKMFGDHVLWAVDVALPEVNPPAVAIRNLRTLADRAYAKANGIVKGPVHLNFPFRKPLEPTPVETDVTDIEPHQRVDSLSSALIAQGVLSPMHEQIKMLTEIISQSRRGIIICGSRTPRGDFPTALAALARVTGFPIWADAISNVRFSSKVETMGGYDTFLMGEPAFEAPDLLIHFGAMPSSAALEAYLNKISPAHRILITESGVWTDPYHRLTEVIQADPSLVCWALAKQLTQLSVDVAWVEHLKFIERQTGEMLQTELAKEPFDGAAIAHVMTQVPADTHVFVASSLPVRHVEQYALPRPDDLTLYSNRGASGIDGTISSAFGVATALPHQQTVLIIGDLAFYHDMNGLLAAKRCNIQNITIVLINNDGGGIFRRLPIADFDPPFTDLFLTPHGLDFEPAIRMYGLDYHRAETLDQLREQVRQSVGSGKATVIEVRTDSKRDFERRNEINQIVQAQLNKRS